jgi:hypothetical protein
VSGMEYRTSYRMRPGILNKETYGTLYLPAHLVRILKTSRSSMALPGPGDGAGSVAGRDRLFDGAGASVPRVLGDESGGRKRPEFAGHYAAAPSFSAGDGSGRRAERNVLMDEIVQCGWLEVEECHGVRGRSDGSNGALVNGSEGGGM